MPRTQTAPPLQERATVTFSESEYLKQPSVALTAASHGQRVEILSDDGSTRVVIYPGTIADVPDTE